MSPRELLPSEMLVDEAGHLSEEGAMVLADGEDQLVPAAILTHASSCAVCQHRIGDAALLALDAGRLLAATAPIVAPELALAASPAVAPVSASARVSDSGRRSDSVRTSDAARARRPMPIGALVLAIVLAAAGATPALARAPHFLGDALELIPKLITLFFRTASAPLVHGSHVRVGTGALVVAALATMVLVLTGLFVARQLPRASFAERGV